MIIKNRYQITDIIGQGQFGLVCKSTCLQTNCIYAIKLENIDASFPLLRHEATILQFLLSQKCVHIPVLYSYGKDISYFYLAMTYFTDGSLLDCKGTMSVSEKQVFFKSMLIAIEKIHHAGIVHRDLKPANFMCKSCEWYIIDFGLATTYLDANQEHKEPVKKTNITGSVNYISYYVHEGYDCVRRDDFLSLVYIFIEMFYGSFLDTSTLQNSFSETDFTSYSRWIQTQKEWDNINSFLEIHKLYLPDMNEALNKMVQHGANLSFQDKPNYKWYLQFS